MDDFFSINVPCCESYRYTKLKGVLTTSAQFGNPDFFVTPTIEYSWTELQKWIQQWWRWKGLPTDDTQAYPAVAHTKAKVITNMQRSHCQKEQMLCNEAGPFGNVRSHWFRHEF